LRKTLLLLFLILPALSVFAATEGSGEAVNIMHQLNRFIFQLAVIIFAARLGSAVFEKLGLPPVSGEIVIGIIIGPYLLGSIPFSIFPHGLFGVPPESLFPVSMELFTFVMVASILHLFVAGLETDVRLFLHFSSTGLLVGISGTILAFFAGAVTGMLLLNTPFFSPETIFLGIMSSVTSVGITTRILSDHRKLDSPVGITILESTVIDDMLGIILLTIALGFFHGPAAGVGPC
jgi:Kef-type K+ transport system membrane component KefB